MRYELGPAEVLEVADALLFRANALGQDKREQASYLRTLAFRFLGTSTRFKEMASRAIRRHSLVSPPQLSTE
jgi:hypothetical protein